MLLHYPVHRFLTLPPYLLNLSLSLLLLFYQLHQLRLLLLGPGLQQGVLALDLVLNLGVLPLPGAAGLLLLLQVVDDGVGVHLLDAGVQADDAAQELVLVLVVGLDIGLAVLVVEGLHFAPDVRPHLQQVEDGPLLLFGLHEPLVLLDHQANLEKVLLFLLADLLNQPGLDLELEVVLAGEEAVVEDLHQLVLVVQVQCRRLRLVTERKLLQVEALEDGDVLGQTGQLELPAL